MTPLQPSDGQQAATGSGASQSPGERGRVVGMPALLDRQRTHVVLAEQRPHALGIGAGRAQDAPGADERRARGGISTEIGALGSDRSQALGSTDGPDQAGADDRGIGLSQPGDPVEVRWREGGDLLGLSA